MHSTTYSKARQELASTMQLAIDDHAPVLITRQNGENCVLVSEADYRATEEMLYLMSSPANAARLNKAVEALRNGEGVERGLIE
ncbi:type II toxin-antitoxin system prevent-host-death family antitoxin [Salmonella enterica]